MKPSKLTFKHFLLHFAIIFCVAFTVLMVFYYYYLPEFTNHGLAIEVPDLKSGTLEEAYKKISAKKLRLKVYDSTFIPNAIPHSIQNQFPEAGEKVKENRSIYISIASRNPPKIRMPKLVGYSLKTAELTLISYGLLIGRVIYVPNANDGAVIKQMIGSVEIKPDVWVTKGTKINLVVGNGLGSENMFIPDLIGLNLVEANEIMAVNGLEIGAVVYDENGTGQLGTIFKQKPEYRPGDSTNTIKTGDVIDVWISGKKPNISNQETLPLEN